MVINKEDRDMKQWYDEWLSADERKNMAHQQKGILARRRQRIDPQNTKGYPKSGDQYQKQAAANADTEQKRRNVSSMLSRLGSRK